VHRRHQAHDRSRRRRRACLRHRRCGCERAQCRRTGAGLEHCATRDLTRTCHDVVLTMPVAVIVALQRGGAQWCCGHRRPCSHKESHISKPSAVSKLTAARKGAAAIASTRQLSHAGIGRCDTGLGAATLGQASIRAVAGGQARRGTVALGDPGLDRSWCCNAKLGIDHTTA
jgi:hypothetical protein